METKQKTVTIEIPEGKKAVWNEQGILQLVDDDKKANEPKDVTERIQTLYDAMRELLCRRELGDCEAKQLLEEYYSVCNISDASDDIIAYLQLRIIAAALNEGWKPQFTKDEKRWFPYFILWTKNEIDNMSDEEKDKEKLLLWSGSDSFGRHGGSSLYSSHVGFSDEDTILGYRLAYKTKALAGYAGRQFASVYARFYIGDTVGDVTPWREFEKKHKSSGNK